MALIAIIDYDMGNLRNVERALLFAGADAKIVRSPAEAAGASGVVLPGVGNFHDAMRNLDRAPGLVVLRKLPAIAEISDFTGHRSAGGHKGGSGEIYIVFHGGYYSKSAFGAQP